MLFRPFRMIERGESFLQTARDAGADVRFTINPDGEHKIQIKRNLTPELVKWISRNTIEK